MATAVTAWASSQSRSSRSSAVVVPKVRTSCPCPPPAPGARTHAVTLFLCTSSPQLRSTMRSIAALLWPCCRPEEGPHHDFARRARWQQFRVPAPPASVSASDSRTTDTRRRPSGSAPFSSPRADFVHARFCAWSKPTSLISWLARVAQANATQRGLRGEGGTPAHPAVSQGHRALAGEGVEGLERGQTAVDAGFARHERFVRADLGEASVVYDHHAIRVLHRGEAVRDDEDGAVLHQLAERLLHQ